jgi:translation initiation factor IF-2
MARWGRVDYKQFENLQKRIEKFEKAAKKEFFEAAAKELAARLLSKVIKRTPVGQYESSTGINGGTLRRGWTAESQRQAEASAAFGGDMGVKKFVDEVKITQAGDTYQIEIINPVEYASYVEYGHRTRDHKGWVPGRFMLTISEQELDAQAPKVLEKKLIKYLGECFNDQ